MYRYTSVRSVEHYGQSRYYKHFVSGHSADTFNLNFFVILPPPLKNPCAGRVKGEEVMNCTIAGVN